MNRIFAIVSAPVAAAALIDSGAHRGLQEIVEPRRAEVRAIAARHNLRLRAERGKRLREGCSVGNIDQARLKQLGDMLELGKVLALQRVRDRDGRDGDARRVACQHQQRMVDGVGREDHHRPLGREPARDQRRRDGVDAAARLLVAEFAPSVARALLQEGARGLCLDRRTEKPREAWIVRAKRIGRGEADRAVRVIRAVCTRRRERDRPVRGARRRAGMFVHQASSPWAVFLWRFLDAL